MMRSGFFKSNEITYVLAKVGT
jgi:hypothetical protein